MSLSDPTSGSGYTSGQVLPAADATTIATQQVRALDAVKGGTYTGDGTAPIVLNCKDGYAFTVADDSHSNEIAYFGVALWLTRTVCKFKTGASTNVEDTHTFTWKGTTAWPKCDARTVAYAQPVWGYAKNTSSRFAQDGTSVPVIDQDDVTDAGALYIPVTNRPTVVSGIIYYGFSCDGNAAGGGSHGALPATMPQISLIRVYTDNTSTVVGPTVDSSANVAAYDAVHSVEGSTTGFTLTGDETLYLKIEGETGANSNAGSLRIYRAWIRCSLTDIAP